MLLLLWPHLTDLLIIDQTQGHRRVLSAESLYTHKLESNLNPKFTPVQVTLVEVKEEQMMKRSLH